ncbi:MAG TPA: hypothetical protein VKU87_05890 [Thermomicrobiaceae bacterium]|nr:hypothetical protein [Thermomicrobiaceae bacterium]
MHDQILVVEPDRSVGAFLYEVLSERGLSPLVCSRIADGCRVLGSTPVAGVIVNLWLAHERNDDAPLIGLLDIVTARKLPVIAISTDARPLQARLTDGATLTLYPITMPFDLDNFLRAMSRMTALSRPGCFPEPPSEAKPSPRPTCNANRLGEVVR